jgi:hypothetical protein
VALAHHLSADLPSYLEPSRRWRTGHLGRIEFRVEAGSELRRKLLVCGGGDRLLRITLGFGHWHPMLVV